ncbi:MAG: hypothetical protein ACRDTA_20370 [Pseudonocardiaceae bacterium]
MSDIQIVIVLAAGASVVVILGCLILVVMIRLRRVVTLQLKTIDELLGPLRAGRGRDTPREPSS